MKSQLTFLSLTGLQRLTSHLYIIWYMHACSVAKSSLTGTPLTIARQAPPSMGFPRQEYWRRLPFPSLRGLPNPGIEPCIFCISCIAGRFVLLVCLGPLSFLAAVLYSRKCRSLLPTCLVTFCLSILFFIMVL